MTTTPADAATRAPASTLQDPARARTDPLDRLAIDTIRTLAIDGVQKAKSGHPGAPMGAAPMAYVLWTRFLRHAPTRPDWPGRDRFVLSAGHASMLLYSLLHLTGYDVTIDDLKSFRQWGSRTPGHPEFGLTAGVEGTTGPLGQGISNAVGMAIAQRRLASEFETATGLLDHWTYGICSDGDLQEGVASEACSLAGHLRLGRLVFLYDDNRIQLDGPTEWAWSEDVTKRFDAYGWHTQRVEDGNDLVAIERAIEAARGDERPSLICVRTHIGYGSPNRQDSQKAHGQQLGDDEVRLTKEAYGWDPDLQFFVPEDVARHFRQAVTRGETLVAEWERALDAFVDSSGETGRQLKGRLAGELPNGWDADLPSYQEGEIATRNASQDAIQALAGPVPELFGGSADLSESNLTDVKTNGHDHFAADHPGRNLRFGVREHGMGAIANGIAYHGGFIPYAATFLNFSDYMRGAVRLASLAGLHVIYVWTHDSVGLGEDGPTHQPVEHYAALRAIPNLWFVRPGDPNEAIAAWRVAVARGSQDLPSVPGPVGLSLTRQKLPVLAGTKERARDGVARGGYVLRDDPGTPDVILIGTGSELQLAMGAADKLAADGIAARVVSMPCWELFELQDDGYRESVLPAALRKRVSVEVGVTLGWDRYTTDEGAIIGLDHFGASAPAATIFEELGFTVDRVADVARRVVREGFRGRVPALAEGHVPGHGVTGLPRDGRRAAGRGDGEAGSMVDRTSDSDPGHS
jgi:transketolase